MVKSKSRQICIILLLHSHHNVCVWEGNMRPMMKRHVSIFKRLIYFGYLRYLGYLGYPRYPGYPKHSGGTSGTL
ncbi:hypothetical protein CISIN_1g035108mg [Citrus sinensis]|uniref:Uncharacterized protein n=1 Tax=Citrus sinensis TaxID=2711 RepID=A0A067GAU2_CITSI|nr:hypothetical protein CISIN_1g035108mg [Citrus sinensis]